MTFAWIACGLLAAQPEVEGDGVRVLVVDPHICSPGSSSCYDVGLPV